MLCKTILTPTGSVLATAGPPQPYASGRHPVVELVDRLAQRDDRSLIAVKKPGLSLRLERRAQGQAS